ncbi:MAG: hybrid sensor histidine kinase/response regulator [Bacteroidales bacterium]|nr:hybrid sensor histidine kinase/response regulator [Bacteroidales bacterium]
MKKAIICVDDEDIILEALKDQLGTFFEENFIIETATTAEEGLEIYQELIDRGTEVPVVISDYLMPGIRGDEFLIKVHEKNPETLKILLTGHANIDGITNAINNANLYRFIPKPWDRDDLILTVREAVRTFIQELEIREKNKELQHINENLEKLVDERTRELADVNATKDKFFSIIAHDLRNSFCSLLGFSEVLIGNFNHYPDEEKLSMIQTIRQVSEQTYKLLQNLLDWARMQTGKIQFTPEKFNIDACIEDECGLQKNIAKQKEIELTIDQNQPTIAFGDHNMIATVIRNLVSNSIKFTHSNGFIKVTQQVKDSLIYVSVEDSGVGISPENIDKIFKFNDYFNTKGTNNEHGTGLGLILCKEFVLQNGGEISVESTVNVGTKITFTIPLSV